jgi:hypothetical protein
LHLSDQCPRRGDRQRVGHLTRIRGLWTAVVYLWRVPYAESASALTTNVRALDHVARRLGWPQRR